MPVQQSRSDVHPLTWEIPTALVASWCLFAMLALPAGQGLAFLLTGHGFVWPRGALPASVVGLCTGTPGLGLSGLYADQLPATSVVYAVIVCVEVLLSGLVFWGFVQWWRTVGPGAQLGLATTREVRRVLGTGNLRRRRSTIRPDLHQATRPRRHRARAHGPSELREVEES